MHALSLLALLLPLVAAKGHKLCTCRTYTAAQGWETNPVLARWALWDDKSQRCVARPDGPVDDKIDGDTWEKQCAFYGTQDGYYPIDPKGLPDRSKDPLKVDIALGQCFW
ncbi:hypothetical protein E4U17_000971 [Claviceps sp. LM77 group G4]|nr:hypothetical protein E4U17_000971 [Claviceps sp. LM77 group G4]KAG6069250.1 hypothetical protein E4U16_007756 [Claviceps sp. LM84 group G4]KAG6073384.1 hypothetical protein E4U33_002928 [Claviceps sp. LM78 group G4]